MASTFTVVTPLVQVRLDNGGYAHVYQGGVLPENADPEHAKQLVAEGQVVKGDFVPEPQRAYDPGGDPVSVEVDVKAAGKKQARSQASEE